MGPCMASAAARPMASVVFWGQRAGDQRSTRTETGVTGAGSGSTTYFGFDHLGDVVLQGGLNTGQLSRDCVAQQTNYGLQTLRDR